MATQPFVTSIQIHRCICWIARDLRPLLFLLCFWPPASCIDGLGKFEIDIRTAWNQFQFSFAPFLFVVPSIRMAFLCFLSFRLERCSARPASPVSPAEHLAVGWGHDLLSCINRNGSAIMSQLWPKTCGTATMAFAQWAQLSTRLLHKSLGVIAKGSPHRPFGRIPGGWPALHGLWLQHRLVLLPFTPSQPQLYTFGHIMPYQIASFNGSRNFGYGSRATKGQQVVLTPLPKYKSQIDFLARLFGQNSQAAASISQMGQLAPATPPSVAALPGLKVEP